MKRNSIAQPRRRSARTPVNTQPAPSGTRERGHSPWLGAATPRVLPAQRSTTPAAAVPPLWSPPTGGPTLSSATGAVMDWGSHLAASPAKQLQLWQSAVSKAIQLATSALPGVAEKGEGAEVLPQDKRFADPLWRGAPFAGWVQAFLLGQQWWAEATTQVPGVSQHHEDMVSFGARQCLDVTAPSNFVLTNPVVLKQTLAEGGRNLLRGAAYAIDDAALASRDLPPAGAEAFGVGRQVAVTPGSVVFRNRLIELIQYAPTTATTHREPVLMVPAWIMKYYILDLSPHNSLIKFMVDQGFTVFVISWKNPDANDADLGLEDYYRLGVLDALHAIDQVMPGARTHALGYCLGGTLLAMAAAALGRDRSTALKSVTLLAAQTDFTEPGELSLFIDESQLAALEGQMARQGYLDKRQMGATFQMLRSRDLVWSYRLGNYLLGQRQPASDLMAWNADGTRLPYRMHAEYLRALFLENALAHGQFRLDGRPLNLNDIRAPIFSVGTVQDHVAPWRSVFKLNLLTDAPITFVLTAGGHNVGIVNPPGQAKSSYRIGHWRRGERRLTSEEWLASAPHCSGSWWTAWKDWLVQHSTQRRAPPPMGAAARGLPVLEAAPGHYVLQR
jgi:polyhydroxyalkanoate synthase subunit PhaC